ncbi:hypothetical protein KDA_55270 [Dictyobacter alpinus]|uniref:Uncharacterized protein n=1 Tax=Dictyobacter alpinus TaxID=2014873 RepID=A0A402BF75_9CHLR|nr:cellulase family glycosylhydrolase [Dictyobacter alpinus]GCE30043.1 hypothetical protein KDA_55270 [Dictyobacter alpinus]
MDVTRRSRLFRIITLCLLTLVTTFLLDCWQPGHAHAATVPNTVFVDTTNPSFSITTTSDGSYSYTVTDINGSTVTSGQATSTNQHISLTLAPQSDGYYTLNIANKQITFVVVAPPTHDASSQFGNGLHFESYDPNLAPLVATTGAGWARADLTWANIEKTQGQYDFSVYDPWMNALQQQGITPFVILDYSNPLYDGGNTPYDDAGYSAYANYAQAVLHHYGSQITAVEVWNEYNWNAAGPCSRSTSCYVQLLKTAYQAVKAVNTNITVVGGAVAEDESGWFDGIFQGGGLQYMDAVSGHPYTDKQTAAPENTAGTSLDQQMIGLEGAIKQYNNGQPKPIWISELGWPTCCAHVNETDQANYLVRGAVLALAGGVQKFFWYDFLDDGGNPDYTEHHFGVLRLPDSTGTYTPKPSYAAYATMTHILNTVPFEASEAVGSNVYDERFANNTRVFWSTAGTQQLTVSADNPVTVTTMTGHTQVYTPSNGSVTLPLSASPIYVQGALNIQQGQNPGTFSTGFENGDMQLTWTNSVDNSGGPAGGSANITGICCGLSGPELNVGDGGPLSPHGGSHSLLYSGNGTNASGSNYAYLKAFDLSSHPIAVTSATTLSYWINPESSANSYNYASGNNSTCVAIDLIFSDNTNLRDSGATDTNGNRAHPAYQCNHLTLDTWNHVTINLGATVSGKTIVRLDIGYDQPSTTGGYRGYLDDISIG